MIYLCHFNTAQHCGTRKMAQDLLRLCYRKKVHNKHHRGQLESAIQVSRYKNNVKNLGGKRKFWVFYSALEICPWGFVGTVVAFVHGQLGFPGF